MNPKSIFLLSCIRWIFPGSKSTNEPTNEQAANEVGIPTLPPVLTEDLASDVDFLRALYQILMHVHLVKGTLTCPATGRQFVVSNGIPNMILEEEECERVRY